jgi:hypothetical protein
MNEGLPNTAEQELSPEQQEARGVLRGLTQAMAGRVSPEAAGTMMHQAHWRGQRGAKLVYLRMGEATSLKVHGAGATGESSEYTFGTLEGPDGTTTEELTVQHPTNSHVPTDELNDVDINFLRYVESEFYDQQSEIPYGE